jgi:hypothetical protein
MAAMLYLALVLLPGMSRSQELVEAADSLHQAKEILDFYKAAIANPSQIITLDSEIQSAFASDPTRYKGLSNKFGQDMHWFEKGPLHLDYVEVGPSPSPVSDYGYYSIKIKKLTKDECEIMVGYAKLMPSLVRANLNGHLVFKDGRYVENEPQCESEWFFQDGKNVVEFISY